MKKLTDVEVTQRMQELRNLRKLHAHDREQIAVLRAEVRQLKQEKADDRAYFEALIQKQAIQIAELQTMVFGRKRKPPTGTVVPVLSAPAVPPRSKDSYHRPIPPAKAITAEVVLPLPDRCICSGAFDPDSVTMHERYE